MRETIDALERTTQKNAMDFNEDEWENVWGELVQKQPEWIFTPQQIKDHYIKSSKVNKNYVPIEGLEPKHAKFLVEEQTKHGNKWKHISASFNEEFGIILNPRDIDNKWQCILNMAIGLPGTPTREQRWWYVWGHRSDHRNTLHTVV